MGVRSINPWQVCEGNMGPWQAQVWQEHEGTLSRAAGVLLAFWLAKGGEGAELFQVVSFLWHPLLLLYRCVS